MNKLKIVKIIFALSVLLNLISACSDPRSTGLEYAPNMYQSKAFDSDQPNPNFKDGKTAQLPPDGTMPIGFDHVEEDYPNTLEGYESAGKNLSTPYPLTRANLIEGKSLYVNMCSHCHGFEGRGDGTIVNLGKYPPPPSYSTGVSSRGGAMKSLTDGKIFHTITYGVNLMGSHKYQLTAAERWKIVMYVHELQKLK